MLCNQDNVIPRDHYAIMATLRVIKYEDMRREITAEYKRNLDLKINNTALSMATHPKVLGLTLDRKLT